jgi:hypothetical protein
MFWATFQPDEMREFGGNDLQSNGGMPDDARLAARDGLARATSDVRLAILGQRFALACQSEIGVTAVLQT